MTPTNGIDDDSRSRGYEAALAAVLIWALVPVGTRFFVLRVDPYVFNIIRFTASGCSALPFFLYAKPWRWPKQDQWLLLACAFLAVPGYNIPVALGARAVTAGELGLLIATESVMIVALTLLLRHRTVHRRILGGSFIALLGVILTSGIVHSHQAFRWHSILEVLFGAFSWSLYTVLAVRLNQRYGTLGVTGAIVVLGTLALLAFSMPMMNATLFPDRATVLLLAAMGIASSLLGFFLWNYAGALVPAERLGLFLYMIPVVSVCAGVQFLSESLTIQFLIGGVLIVGGVWLASRGGSPAAVIESAPRSPKPRDTPPAANPPSTLSR